MANISIIIPISAAKREDGHGKLPVREMYGPGLDTVRQNVSSHYKMRIVVKINCVKKTFQRENHQDGSSVLKLFKLLDPLINFYEFFLKI